VVPEAGQGAVGGELGYGVEVGREVLGGRVDDAVLIASEFATNCVLHSDGGAFTLRAEIGQDRVRIEVEDAGGLWRDGPNEDGRPHGFDVVAAIAGAGNWGILPRPAMPRGWPAFSRTSHDGLFTGTRNMACGG
jgi:hypothetical protein